MHPNGKIGTTQMICKYKIYHKNHYYGLYRPRFGSIQRENTRYYVVSQMICKYKIMICEDLGLEAYGEKTLDITQCSHMHPNQRMGTTQMICKYKIMVCEDLGLEAYREKILDITQCSHVFVQLFILLSSFKDFYFIFNLI
jgi:hypothetical protein